MTKQNSKAAEWEAFDDDQEVQVEQAGIEMEEDIKASKKLDGASDFLYSKEEEARLVRKLDWRVIGLDKTGFGDMERDLGMTDSSQFNWCLSIFFFGYIIFEVPSNNMLKAFTPSVWIARIMITWGLCASLMAFTFNFGSLMAARAFLGVFEAGFL
ncbi:hypothetical protein HDU97_001599 [Phlyctochytrium planicorne]|nr:hypothetical protein HDU97_001599 [Phlyctochytrium planicorne]